MQYGQVLIDAEVMSGAPVFAGTRVPIQNLFDYIEGGEDLSEFLDDFPAVSKEAVLAVLCLRGRCLHRTLLALEYLRKCASNLRPKLFMNGQVAFIFILVILHFFSYSLNIRASRWEYLPWSVGVPITVIIFTASPFFPQCFFFRCWYLHITPFHL